MRHDKGPSANAGGLPSLTLQLGYAGLLPQGAAALVALAGGPDIRFGATVLAFAYGSLILSFLGGIWWGMAAARPDIAPAWLWIAAVMPSLYCLAIAMAWTLGGHAPRGSLFAVAAGLAISPLVDRSLERLGLAPRGWTRFRVQLSGCLAILTALAAMG